MFEIAKVKGLVEGLCMGEGESGLITFTICEQYYYVLSYI